MERLVPVFLASVALFAVANDDAAITQETMELKKGQEAILRDLAEIKKLLADRPSVAARPPTVQQIDASVALGGITPRGNPAAPLTLIEFSDYQCPFCRRHAEQTVPQLVAEYVDSGKLRYTW
jgi:protein-disulfide isomerase